MAIGFVLGLSLIPFSPSSNNIIISSGIANASGGGPIVLDGMDPVCHSGYESTGQYIARVLKNVHTNSVNSNNGHIAVLGSNGGTNSCGASWATKINEYTSEFDTAPAFDFYTTNAGISAFFDSTINSSTPAMLWIPDNWSRSSATEAIFTANAEKIADFVNSGGGLFANNGTYGWLTALLPSAVFNNGGCNGGPEATPDGVDDFSLNNTIVAACWHGYFTGDVGTLKTLVDYPYPSMTSTRKAVSIGGGSVSLPSSFTLSVNPPNPEAGQDITITATAQTLAGVPQAGVVVTVTVSSGPDAGNTLTGTTNSAGIAIITIRTNSTGTAVYTATATVNGVAKTVSATVVWDPPTVTTTIVPTTTVAPTTIAPPETTIPLETTTVPEATIAPASSLAPVTTEAPVIQEAQKPSSEVSTLPVQQATTTTVHDHSSHSHSPSLPNTGSGHLINFILANILIITGYFLITYKKNNKSLL